MPIPTVRPNKKPTDILMEVLEDLGRAEADTVIVIYMNEKNEIILKHNTDYVVLIGVGEWLKNVALRRMAGEE